MTIINIAFWYQDSQRKYRNNLCNRIRKRLRKY